MGAVGPSPWTRRELVRRAKLVRRAAYEAVGSERMSRPALYDLDRLLAPHLPPGPGTFVEVGANDGYTQSNTYHLERVHGWTGVLVEPFPHLFSTCQRLRRRSACFNCALVAPEQDGQPVEMVYADLMSLVRGARGGPELDRAHVAAGERTNRVRSYTTTVPGRALSSVLAEAGVASVDLLVVDTEGYELPVLQGADLPRLQPGLVLVELNDPTVADWLSGSYDLVGMLTAHDALFRLRP